jgi:hypothetical protein
MKKFLRILGVIIFIALVVAVHIGFSYVIPYPFSKLNIIFLFLLLFLLLKNSGLILWVSFFSHFLLELYANTPFGIILFASTMSILCSIWLYRIVFTNRSWYTAIILTFIALLIYRFFYLLLFFIYTLFVEYINIYWSALFLVFFWEILITSLAVGLLFFFSSNMPNKKQSIIFDKRLFRL